MYTASVIATDLAREGSGRRSWFEPGRVDLILLGGALVLLAVLVVLLRGHRAAVLRRQLARRWGRVDEALDERHELVTFLIQTAGRHLPGESGVVERLVDVHTEAAVRSDRPPAARQRPEAALTDAMRELYAVARRSPALLADPAYARLRARLVACDERIADRLPAYNESVRRCRRGGPFAGVLRVPRVEHFRYELTPPIAGPEG